MLKSKGAILAIALGATALVLAGLAITTTTGAATDPTPGGAPSSWEAPTGNPPAAPIDQPAPTDPGTVGQPTSPSPAGAPAGAGEGPGALPSAGFGTSGDGSSMSLIVLLGMAGVALVGAGATAVTARRK
jgi:hypothetical protein